MRGRKKIMAIEIIEMTGVEKKYSARALQVIYEFSKRTTLDGIKYVGDRTRHWTER